MLPPIVHHATQRRLIVKTPVIVPQGSDVSLYVLAQTVLNVAVFTESLEDSVVTTAAGAIVNEQVISKEKASRVALII